jgi:hypothetical protein
MKYIILKPYVVLHSNFLSKTYRKQYFLEFLLDTLYVAYKM